jgi:heat shock protein HslJ
MIEDNYVRWMVGAGLLTTLFLHAARPLQAQIEEPVATAPDCEIQLSLSSPGAGATEVPLSVIMSGTALDVSTLQGTGISQVQAFLGSRDEGGDFLGDANFVADSQIGEWNLLARFPDNAVGPRTLFIYGQSAISGMEASLGVPITIGEATPAMGPSSVFCPSTVVPSEPVAVAETPFMTNVEWQWTAADDPSAYTITFMDNGLFQLRADCNVAVGGFVIEGDILSLATGPTTLAQCPPGSLFDEFIGNIAQVSSFEVDEGNLVLTLGDTGDQMVFTPGSETGAPAPMRRGPRPS